VLRRTDGSGRALDAPSPRDERARGVEFRVAWGNHQRAAPPFEAGALRGHGRIVVRWDGCELESRRKWWCWREGR
jgi:hypothetical protein